MGGRDKKAQLGARVPPEVRERAIAAARAERMSLNAWVEKTLRAATEGVALPPPETVPGQMTVDDMLQLEIPAPVTKAELVENRPTGKFAPNCVNATYHWKHGPGNPCGSCGGET